MKKAAERYSPDLEECISTLPDDPVIDDSKIRPEIGDSESPSEVRSMDRELSSEENTNDQSLSIVPTAKHIPKTTAQITKPKSIWWIIGGGVLLAFLAFLFKVWKRNSNE